MGVAVQTRIQDGGLTVCYKMLQFHESPEFFLTCFLIHRGVGNNDIFTTIEW